MQIVIWVAASALLLLAIRSLYLLRRLKKTDLKEGLVFEDALNGFEGLFSNRFKLGFEVDKRDWLGGGLI